MSPATVLLVLLGFGAVALAWWANMAAREVALAAGRRACRERGAVLLDWAMAHQRYGLSRDTAGRLRLQRTYTFEFTGPGMARGHGWLILRGRRPVAVRLEQPEGGTELERLSAAEEVTDTTTP